MVYKITWFIVFLTSFSSIASAHNFCSELFSIRETPLSRDFLEQSQQGFDSFQVEKIGFSSQTFKVMTPNGKVYALRLSSILNNLNRENYVYGVVTQLLGLSSPRQELFNIEDSQKVTPLFEKHSNYYISELYKARLDSSLKNQWPVEVSIAEWLRLPTGEEWMQKRPIDQNLRSQLVDWWAALTVLNITDFHHKNWLTDGQKVWGIDFALMYFDAKPGEELDDRSRQGPFHGYPLNSVELYRITQGVSQSMIDKLKNITQSDLEMIAKDSGYRLRKNEFELFQTRLNQIIELRTKIKN